MKVLKYSMLVLVISVVGNIVLANAAITLQSFQTGIMGTAEIPAVGSVKTDSVIKDKLDNQTFYNLFTNTPKTNPCKKCNIVATLQKNVNGTWTDIKSSTNVVMGESYTYVLNTAQVEGTYRLSLIRNDLTIYTTFVNWQWDVQSAS
jgi:hypothetical protein